MVVGQAMSRDAGGEGRVGVVAVALEGVWPD